MDGKVGNVLRLVKSKTKDWKEMMWTLREIRNQEIYGIIGNRYMDIYTGRRF